MAERAFFYFFRGGLSICILKLRIKHSLIITLLSEVAKERDALLGDIHSQKSFFFRMSGILCLVIRQFAS